MRAAKGVLRTEVGVDRASTGPLGFSPQAAVAWWSCQADFGSARGNRGGIGLWTGGGSTAVAWSSGDGLPAISTHHVADDAAVVGLGAANGDVAMRADLESLDSNGVTLCWTRRPAETWIVHFLALGGLTDARTGWVASSAGGAAASPGNADRDLVLLVPAPSDPTERLTIGIAATASGREAAAGYACRGGDRPGAVVGTQRLGAPTTGLGASRFAYLSLAGVRAKVGVDVSAAVPGTRRTRVGFRPDALLLFSWGLAKSRHRRGIGRLCLGGVVGETSGSTSWDDCNVDTGETGTHVASSIERALVVADTRTGGVHAEAAVRSFDDRGFTLDWTRSDRERRQFVYVALSGDAAAQPLLRARISRALRPRRRR